MNIRARELYNNINIIELKRRKLDFIFIQVMGYRYFLIGNKEVLNKLPQRFPIAIEQQTKNSLSRQIQELNRHPGRIPQQYRTELFQCVAVKLPTPQVGMYKAYQIIL